MAELPVAPSATCPMVRFSAVKRRQRSENTSTQQIEAYLNLLETDAKFRSGVQGRTVDRNYVETKWEELVNKLNSMGNGPVLDIDSWKKRFNDWKNAVRHKERAIKENRFWPPRGPKSKTILNELEERGLAVWGPATRMFASAVMPTASNSGMSDDASEDGSYSMGADDFVVTVMDNEGNQSGGEDSHLPAAVTSAAAPNAQGNPTLQQAPFADYPRVPSKRVKSEKDPYMINATEQVVYENIEREKLKVEKLRLRFEIEKYKFENPSFHFDYSL